MKTMRQRESFGLPLQGNDRDRDAALKVPIYSSGVNKQTAYIWSKY